MSDNTISNNTLIFKLEKDIAIFLLGKLEHFQITFERASQIAKFILAHLPENITDEQLMKILPSLDDEFVELASIVHKYMLDYEKKYKDLAVQKISDLVKHRHFEEISKVCKDYFGERFIK